ncbi:choline-responsive transcriptional repressor BetI [Paracoccus pacificus]|uniref:HTH-type transcriptional regulator BetI n=1 Tax=Paracoccus pacificus TaxID=1463598 RepID=A0ABW4RAM0_9RHOB
MPKLGAEPIRRAALVKAAIATIGQAGSLDVTVAQIARKAGMSSALAHHYFGSKDQIFLAAMRQILADYAGSVRARLAQVQAPAERLDAIITGSFAPDNFHDEVISAWLNFYAMAQVSPDAARLLRVYRRRLRSNLLSALRPLTGDRAEGIAATTGALIDGVYLRAALSDLPADPDRAAGSVRRYLDGILKK